MRQDYEWRVAVAGNELRDIILYTYTHIRNNYFTLFVQRIRRHHCAFNADAVVEC